MIAPAPGRTGSAKPFFHGIDHIGVVVHDIAAEVERWRALGFLVSDPVALFSAVDGAQRPLGQMSAHVVFANGYVELSAPIPGAGNHLEPYLALGEGVRILVHAAADILAAHAAVSRRAPGTPAPRSSTRAVKLGDRTEEARFQWFPLPVPTIPGILCAVVMHETPEIVFHASLTRHPNGLERIGHLAATGGPGRLRPFPVPADEGLHVVLAEGRDAAPLALTGFAASGKTDLRNFVF